MDELGEEQEMTKLSTRQQEATDESTVKREAKVRFTYVEPPSGDEFHNINALNNADAFGYTDLNWEDISSG